MEGSREATQSAWHATTRINGAEIYHEVRGDGPPVVFVQGTTGDGGSFERVANLLSDEFTVVIYHRRGNSWSPPPSGWTSTTVDEQADDLAALIQHLDLAPAAVFGTSDGATILVNLLIRHPEVLRGAIIHEPLLEPLIPRNGEAREALDRFWALIEHELATSGPRAAMERLIRAVAGDANVDRRNPAFRERLLGNASVYFDIEAEPFATYMPDPNDLARVAVPAMVVAGNDVLGGCLRLTSEWIAHQMGLDVQPFPGAHTPYIDHPDEMVAAMRPFLRVASGTVQNQWARENES
jgi:pimeloyl-ACP methyl ester carboxylesterase